MSRIIRTEWPIGLLYANKISCVSSYSKPADNIELKSSLWQIIFLYLFLGNMYKWNLFISDRIAHWLWNFEQVRSCCVMLWCNGYWKKNLLCHSCFNAFLRHILEVLKLKMIWKFKYVCECEMSSIVSSTVTASPDFLLFPFQFCNESHYEIVITSSGPAGCLQTVVVVLVFTISLFSTVNTRLTDDIMTEPHR